MALARVQAALARLFTDAGARAAFARDPIAAGRALGLDEAGAASLAEVAPRALERFAASLQAKRVLDARKLLPLTAIALGDAFAARLREVLVEPPPGTVSDALALVARLARSPVGAPPWIGDLARYEGAFIRVWRSRFALRVRWFGYPVAPIADALRREARRHEFAPRWSFGIWARAPGGRLRHWVRPIR